MKVRIEYERETKWSPETWGIYVFDRYGNFVSKKRADTWEDVLTFLNTVDAKSIETKAVSV